MLTPRAPSAPGAAGLEAAELEAAEESYLGTAFHLGVYPALGVSTICRQESLLSEPQTHAVEEGRKGCQPCWTVTLLDASKGSPEFLSQQPGSTLSATQRHHGPGVTVKWRNTWAGLLGRAAERR